MARSPRRCLKCGAWGSPSRRISRDGLCRVCGPANEAAAIEAMINRSGPLYRKWLEATIAGHRRTARRLAAELRALDATEESAAV
ncbi:MAG TPA: hypothetical protein VGG32_08460 [Thermoplasmata archaeon]